MNNKFAMIKTKVQKNNNDDNRSEHQEFIKYVNQPNYAINYTILSQSNSNQKQISVSNLNDLSIKKKVFQI